MDISIQNVSRPASVPNANLGVLSKLTPAQIGAPDSGVAASEAGIKMGQQVTGPLVDMGEYLEQYYSPQESAIRQAKIAGANLSTTESQQQRDADLKYPQLPSALRLAGISGAEADALGSTARGQTTKSFIDTGGPTAAGQAESFGAKTKSVESQNILKTTPPADYGRYKDYEHDANVPPLRISADYERLRSEHPEFNLPETGNGDEMRSALTSYYATGQSLQDNAVGASRRGAEVAVAGIPQMSGVQGGGLHRYFDGKKFSVESVRNVNLVSPDDNKTHTYVQGEKSGKTYDDLGIAGSQGMFEQRNEAMNERQDKSIASRSVNIGTDENPITLAPGDAQKTYATIANYKNRGDVQAIVKVAPLVDRALAQIQASKDAKTGIISVDAMLTAARAFRGQVSDTEMRALNAAGGLQNALYKIENIANGKQYDPETMLADLTRSVEAVKAEGNDYLQNKIMPGFRKALPRDARNAAEDLFDEVAHTEGAPSAQAGAGSAVSDSSIPTLSPEEAAKLPKGAQFKSADGILRTRT